ncbi:hypothetical protein EJ066_08115 [Mesorhizobium sp. M9A.F.Ca.ET.002.03.1.2]|uniref:HTH-like domain-containing protein n=1 Tax=Mesorhizobium sp. M9A.F.Ca.ET.002.03.1.2 TaxID=2493668 RepID=UPI000F74E222|nr:hypothetical protein [Mesorhizobium sp. M9A.F.Ca.ET.002.03.1.2]AZN97256.1 hypothetical protein EJ066_08115 [Mesorhizobium sp. M9A.F.Ca.ET.002.03.1.2]
MKIEDAAKILAQMYSTAPDKEKAVHVHLFGIRYADELDGMPLQEIAVRAGISKNYGTEIRKGINLARYVALKS